MSELKRYMVPGGHGVEAHSAGLLYLKGDADEVIDALRAQLAEAQAQVQTARDALDECVPVLCAVAMGDTGYTIGWGKEVGVKARSARALILPTTDRPDAATEE